MIILEISLLSLFIAQFIKIFTSSPPNFSRILSSGGMPSSHAAFVSTLSTSVALKYGYNSDLFAIVVVFSLIVIYDAGGVRRAVGEQANVLNNLLKNIDFKDLTPDRGKEIKKDLKELVGHTPIEVLLGALLGISIALLSSSYILS
ncbi:MAG: divergent PAP2 family protein [Halanaerobiales bacterium]|nr:divergent PAP2 family protein [Halanaerobiales bacterium]